MTAHFPKKLKIAAAPALSIHSPNTAGENNPTTALFVPVDDIGDTLIEKDHNGLFTRA